VEIVKVLLVFWIGGIIGFIFGLFFGSSDYFKEYN